MRNLLDGLVTPSQRPLPFMQMVRILRSNNVIDPNTSALLDDLRVIGNNAAHDTDTVFTKEDALKFRELSNKAMNGLAASVQSEIDSAR